MAQSPAQVRAQIEAVRARLDEQLDELQPIVAQRLHRARRQAQVGAIGAVALIAVLLLPVRRRRRRKRAQAQEGLLSGYFASRRRR